MFCCDFLFSFASLFLSDRKLRHKQALSKTTLKYDSLGMLLAFATKRVAVAAYEPQLAW